MAERIPLPKGHFVLVTKDSSSSGVETTGTNDSTVESSSRTDSSDSTDSTAESNSERTTGEGTTSGHPTTTQSTGPNGSTKTNGSGELAEPRTGTTREQFALRIDPENNSVELIQGTTVTKQLTFKRRPKNAWHSACPKNLSAERLEIVDLQVPQLDFAGVTITAPVLMTGCAFGPDSRPREVFLRGANRIPDLGTFCESDETCLEFRHEVPAGS